MVQILAATVAMVLAGVLLGWFLKKCFGMSVLGARIVGLAIMLFVAPTIDVLAARTPYFEAFFAYGLGAILAGALFYLIRPADENA